MPTIDLSPFSPTAGETSDAGAIGNAFTAIQGAVNGLDNSNVSNTAAIATTKLNLPGGTTTWLRADGNFTAPTVYAVTYQKTTTTDVVNTAAKTDLFAAAFTIAGNAMSSTGICEVYAGGDYLNNSGSNKTFVL